LVALSHTVCAHSGDAGAPSFYEGHGSLLEIRHSSHANFGRSKSNDTSVITDIRQKINLTLRVSPFKITQGHRNGHRSIGYLRLPIVIHINHGPISYRFGDKRQFRSKIANFSHSRLFHDPPAKTVLIRNL